MKTEGNYRQEIKRREDGSTDFVLQYATGGFKAGLQGYELERENLNGIGVVVAVGLVVSVVVMVFGRGGGGLVMAEDPGLELVDEGGDGGVT